MALKEPKPISPSGVILDSVNVKPSEYAKTTLGEATVLGNPLIQTT